MVKQYQFSDAFGNGESVDAEAKMGSGKSGSGCYVSVTTGFVLTFLAIAIAVGVGIIVHFAERDGYDRQVTCTFPEGASFAEYLRSIMGYMSTSRAETSTPTATTPTTAAAYTTRTTLATTSGPSHDLGYRLPKDLRPIHYDLELQPDIYGNDPSRFGFRGRVCILIEVESATRRIVINAFNLSIVQSDVSVTGVTTPGNVQVLALAQHDDVEMLVVSLQQELIKGAQYQLNISFSGPLTNDLDGLYLSSYQRGDQTVYLATTQFESPDAREAFPCFDEPAFKANFSVTLLRKPPLISLSNSKIKQTEQRSDGWLADVYETTPAMSTYLLAFIICDFDHVNGTTTKGIEYRIYARKELKSSTEYALQTGMTILDYYGDVFGTNFPLKKQDMIAIPDFGSGAMENWGLVTYRETNIIYAPGDTERQRQQVTLVIAHELAHMWFGDLVTLAWWDDLWLNEGFAEFVEYIGMDKIEPKWKIWEQFAVDVVQFVFEVDQIMSSHPLFSPAKTVEEMEQYFDSISYEKAASVIRMIRFCIGEDVFSQGLKTYLQEHKYGNANHTDLWRALGGAVNAQTTGSGPHMDVGQVMDTWTLQMGFPVVKVTRDTNGGLTATQKRFLINPGAKDPGTFHSPYGYKWEIPLTMTSSVQPKFDISKNDVLWLHKEEETKSFTPLVSLSPPGNSDDWFLVNVHQYGYYRVNYDVNNWQALVTQLKKNHNVFPPVNRAQIIDDAWNLANAGETHMDVALSTLEYLEQEEDYVPWAAANKQLSALRTRTISSPGYGSLEKFIQTKVRGLFNKLGFDDANATALQSYTRTIAVSLACKSGLPECISGAVRLFKQWRQRPLNSPISPAVRDTVYCVGVAEGSYDDWLFVRERFREEQSPNEKVSLRKALACSRRVWVLSTLLTMSIAQGDIRVGDATSVMADVAANELGTGLTWKFVMNNWDVIFKDFAQSNARLKKLLDNVAAPYHDDVMRQELIEFLESHKDLGRVEVLVRQALEAVEFNIKWYSISYPLLTKWLIDKGFGEPATVREEKDLSKYRLPTNIRPLHYDLELQPDIYGENASTFSFQGHVTILIECLNSTNTVVLNAKNMTIEKSNITLSAANPTSSFQVKAEPLDDGLERLTLVLDRPLLQGSIYSLRIAFWGPLTDDLMGLYLSSYQQDGKPVYLATTQFEPAYARQAFPCFDEPAYKASFGVTLLRRNPLISLSNTKINRTENRAGGWIADVYFPTPKMSTYLLAFVICDFVRVSGTTPKGVEFGVWVRKGLENQADYALQTGMKILDYYGTVYKTDFPLQKQDMIAIPDFAAGAMENWGLVTYRETYLLYKVGVSSEKQRQQVTSVIAHELAHQWFGNLVTMAWWDDIWLNEGFANFVQYIGQDMIDPKWKIWEQFMLEALQYVFAYDQIVTSHPLYTKSRTVAEMEQYFDVIAYQKGASVIRMLQFCLGNETFQRGLQRYLHTYNYSNAAHTDLWNAWAAQAAADGNSLNVSNVMDTWTLQMGFPVVTLSRLDNDSVTATQKRFLINPDASDPRVFTSPFGYQWEIPITMTSSAHTDTTFTNQNIQWLHKHQQSATLRPRVALPPVSDTKGWYLANVHQYGYYRVNYPDSNWQALVQQLKTDHKVIPPINRAQIINDAWNLASAGELRMELALSTLDYLDKEEDFVPWSAAQGLLGSLRTRTAGTSSFDAVQKFAQEKVKGLFTRMGMDDTNATSLQSYMRSVVVRTACGSGLPQCVQAAFQLFRQWKQQPDHNPISPGLRGQVYCTAVSEGDDSDWQFALSRFQQEGDPSEKDLLRRALSCTRRVWTLRKLLEMSLSGGIKRDDATGTIGDVANNLNGGPLAWDFVRDNWDRILNEFAQSNSRLKYMMDSIVSTTNSEVFRQELVDFISSLSELGRAEQVLNQALETVEYNIKWHKDYYAEIVQWLANYGAVPQVKNVRLPTNLRPLHYNLTIEPNMYDNDPATFTFNGTMAMDFQCKESTDRIVLHINELSVSSIQLTGPSGVPAVLPGEEVDTELQFLIIKLARNLTKGANYTVSMVFQGPLDNKTLDGLYLSSYKRNSTTIYLATTQFEPTDARKAFPCMDEPALKATFTITLVRRVTNKALSNMPVEHSTNLGGDRIADRFQTTLPMSTYLVALIVCDFEKMTNQTKRNITYEVWARPEAVSQVEFALQYGVQIIDHYEEYFNVSFPLPKQAMIAIPDFAAGAMENWGLITYRETRILFQQGVSSAGDKEASAMTIAHELAHMWFGDLVSPQWWDELWLNEGFARFMQYLGTDHVHPEWREWDQFVVVNVHSAMRMDGLVSSHPVYVPVATPEQINEIFDLISYSKGAAIIRMIRHALGEETFKKGITNYLRELAYKNANHTDLWNALNKQAQLDGRNFSVGDVMDTWTKQMNYPVVTVTRRNSSLVLNQQRYLQDSSAKELGVYTSPFNYSWDIPFTFTFESQARFNSSSSDVVWLMHAEPEKIITVSSLRQNDWVIGNIKEVGYYRVNYDISNWEKLAQQLRNNHTVIEPANRAQIIDDAWNLANGGYLKLSVALAVTEYLDEEMDYVPWRAATQQLEYVGRMLATTEYYGAFKNFMANKTSNQYAALGMNNTGAELLQSFLRSSIALYSCKYDSKGCVEDAMSLFKQWRNRSDVNPIQPELRGAVYCTAMRNGDEGDWEFLFRRLLAETNANEVDRIQSQLACSGRQWVLRRLLSVALYSGLVRSQSSLTVVTQVMLNPEGTSLAWDFIRQSWSDIFSRYRKDPFALKNLVDPMGTIFNSPLQLQELQAFVDGHPDLGTATRAFQGAVESVRSNVKWMTRHYREVTDWLLQQGFALRFPQ